MMEQSAEGRVTLEVVGGPTIEVAHRPDMTVRQVLEAAYDSPSRGRLTYGLQYYGERLGYLVMMINENYDSFDVTYEPDFFWVMAVNGTPSEAGIDQTKVVAGDRVSFRYAMRAAGSDTAQTQVKFDHRQTRRDRS